MFESINNVKIIIDSKLGGVGVLVHTEKSTDMAKAQIVPTFCQPSQFPQKQAGAELYNFSLIS